MGYKAREKKRKQRAAVERDRRNSAAGKYWLTIVTRPTKCDLCPRPLRHGEEFVYCSDPLQKLCVACSDRAGIKATPSRNWEKSRQHRRSSTARRGPSLASPKSTSPPRTRAGAPIPTRAEIEAGGHSHKQLAEWGVKLPPRRGWRKDLLRRADEVHGEDRPDCSDVDPRRAGPHSGDYETGERHRAWPEWTWDGSAFVKSEAFDAAAANPDAPSRQSGTARPDPAEILDVDHHPAAVAVAVEPPPADRAEIESNAEFGVGLLERVRAINPPAREAVA